MESLSVLAGLVTTETLRDITAQGLSQLDFKRPVFIAFGYGFSKTLALVLYTAKVARKSYFTGQTTVRRKKKRRINSVPGGEDMNPVNANTHLLGNSCSPQSSYAAATVTASGVDAEGLLDPPEIPAPKVEFSTLLLLPIVPAFFDVLSTFFSFIYVSFSLYACVCLRYGVFPAVLDNLPVAVACFIVGIP